MQELWWNLGYSTAEGALVCRYCSIPEEKKKQNQPYFVYWPNFA